MLLATTHRGYIGNLGHIMGNTFRLYRDIARNMIGRPKSHTPHGIDEHSRVHIGYHYFWPGLVALPRNTIPIQPFHLLVACKFYFTIFYSILLIACSKGHYTTGHDPWRGIVSDPP
jgi:hypothetical protein